MQTITFLPMLLTQFEGGAAAAAGDGAQGAQGETQAAPGNTRRGKTGETILYGKQLPVATETAEAEGTPAAGEKQAEVQTTSNTLEERRKAYFDFINDSNMKDIHTQETQRMINRRFSETKALQQQVDDFSPVKEMLMQRYKVEDGDMGKLLKALENDDRYWSEAAEEAGMTVDQYKRVQQVERQLKEVQVREQRLLSQQRAEQQIKQWDGEAQTLKGLYPSFDLQTEVQNPQFMSLLRSGVPMQAAYEVIHMADIKAGIQRMTATATEKQVTDNIRAKGQRPQENGTSAQSAFTVKDDVRKLTKADRANIARLAARGESITF